MDVALRRLRAEDISQVSEIEREAFLPGWVGTPFKRELNNRYARYLVAYTPQESQTVAEPEPEGQAIPADTSLWGRMVRNVQTVVRREPEPPKADSSLAGYVGIWFQGDQAHITEIAVREELRGQGIGELLLIGSVLAGLDYGSSVVTLEVRVSNFIAQRLYEKYGFKTAGTRKAYYSDNREDALIMTTSPIHGLAYKQLFQELQEKYPSRWREIRIEG
jgi:ribosomal-protein-alanine N-acetyltransferase